MSHRFNRGVLYSPEQEMALPPHEIRHLLCQVTGEPIQENDDRISCLGRVGKNPVQGLNDIA